MNEEFYPEFEKHLFQARVFLAALMLEDALKEVEAAFSYDPLNQEVLSLAREIGERREERFLEELERSNFAPPADPPDTQTAWPTTPDSTDPQRLFILTARRYLQRGMLDAALVEAEEGLKVAPESIELLSLRSQILASLPPGDMTPQKRASSASHVEPESVHLQRARALIEKGSYDDALVEVALGLADSPDDEALRSLERMILDRGADSNMNTERTVETRLTMHLLAAEQFAKHNEFDQALDELAKAFVIDPLNATIARVDQQLRQQREQLKTSPLRLVYKNENTTLRRQAL